MRLLRWIPVTAAISALSSCHLVADSQPIAPFAGTYTLLTIEHGDLPQLTAQDSTFKQFVEGGRIVIFPNDSGVVVFRTRVVNSNGKVFLGAIRNPFQARERAAQLLLDFADPRVNTNFTDSTFTTAQDDLVLTNRSYGLGRAHMQLGALTFRRVLMQPPPDCHRPSDIGCSLFY
jgi:hypothetical protein